MHNIPLKDLAVLEEKLVALRGALSGKAGARKDGPLMEVGEVADCPAEIQRMPSPGENPLASMSACNIWPPEPLMSPANQPAQAQNVAGSPLTGPKAQILAPTQFLPPNVFPSSGEALSVGAGTAGSLAVQAGISQQGQFPGAAVPPLRPHYGRLSDPALPAVPSASVLVPWPQAPLWFAAPQSAVAAGQTGPKSFIGMIPIPAAGLDPVVAWTPSALSLRQPRERNRGVNSSAAHDPRAVSACANPGTVLAAVSSGPLAQAGANQMHVVAGGRRDQETSVISEPPFPTSLGTANLLMKDGTSYSIPGNPTGSVSASGFPSDPGVKRTWREEITLEERHHLVQKFAEAISGGSHSAPRTNGPMEIPILYAKEVEEKMYRSAVSKCEADRFPNMRSREKDNKSLKTRNVTSDVPDILASQNDYRKLLAVELRKIEKELQGKQGSRSSTPRVLGDQPTACASGASPADIPPMAAIMGLVELGIPRGPALLSGPQKRCPGGVESSANPNMEDPQPSPPSGLDDTRRPGRRDPQQPPEEKRHAGSSEDALAECDQDVTQTEASEPPPKKQKTDPTDCTQRAILVQELLAAYKNYANYVTIALNQDRDKLDNLVVRLLGPSNQPNLLKEAEGARALMKTLKKTLVLLKCLRDEDPRL
ncbi:uncharacterized protein LOC110090649 isoform X3 [Pogona vitticeps]